MIGGGWLTSHEMIPSVAGHLLLRSSRCHGYVRLRTRSVYQKASKSLVLFTIYTIHIYIYIYIIVNIKMQYIYMCISVYILRLRPNSFKMNL